METYEPGIRRRPRLSRWRTGGLLLSLVAAVAAGQAPAVATTVDDRPHAGGALIRRTAHGIPHILAADYRGLGLGAGYAFAEDNLCPLADKVLTLSGQRSRWFGADHLASDLYHTWVNQSRVVERLLARPAPLGPSPQARELARGYAAGYNRYLTERTAAGLPDPACRGAGWVRPLTELDIWRGAYQIAGHTGGEALRDWVAHAAPPGASAVRLPATAPADASRPVRADTRPASNAIAIGRSASVGHTGLLLANPHLPWRGDLRLYQQQLTIAGKVDVSGSGFQGLPVVNFGHNDRLAWSHTGSTAQTVTLTRLTLAPGDPTSYLVDGRPRPMERTAVTVTVRQADGTLVPFHRTVHRSADGPIIEDPFGGLDWSEEFAYALHDANADNLRVIDQSLALARSRDVAQVHAALGRHLGIPWATTVAVDASGTAYFGDVQVVPHVTDELVSRCGVAPDSGWIVLDGSRSACGWGTDPDAVTPGLFGPARLPTLTRTDTVSNMNDSPWLSNPAVPLTGYPAIIGDVGTARIERTRLGLDMIADRLDGSDGLGAPGFTLETLQATMLANRNLLAEEGRPAVVAMCGAHPRLRATDGRLVDVRAACAALADWNGRGDLRSRGAYLWQKFIQRAREEHGPIYAVPFDPADPLHTPRGVAADRPGIGTALADTVQSFARVGLPVDVALEAVQRYAGVPIHGCEVGCFNVILDENPPLPPGSPRDVLHGSTFIMAVELTETGPRARTLLTYGQSSNPASPFHTDQARRYSAKQWVTGRFTAAEIARDPALTVRALPG